MVFIAFVSRQQGSRNAIEARPVELEVAPEGPVEKTFGVFPRNRSMFEIELELPMDIGVVHIAQQTAFFRHLLIERSSRHGVYSMNWWKSVSCDTACSISAMMLSGVWCSSPMMVDPCTRIPCSRNSRVSCRVSAPCNLL